VDVGAAVGPLVGVGVAVGGFPAAWAEWDKSIRLTAITSTSRPKIARREILGGWVSRDMAFSLKK
jgi:hypothetical protein